MQKKYLDELFELLEIPTISSEPAHNKDGEKACSWLKDRLLKLRFKTEILPTAGQPVVYGENLEAGSKKPTILIYGHYDVQSPEPLEEWDSDPFKPEIRSGNIYARGVADDKGQIYTWIAAVDKLLGQKSKLPLNLKFLIEGEEEIGSSNLDKFIEENKTLLKADICVISDSDCINENQPLILYGLRGLTYMEVRIKSLGKDAHSGVYGGNVVNPANELARIISKLKDDGQKILIPGFYDNVRKVSEKERKELIKTSDKEDDILKETGAKAVVGEAGLSIHERAGIRPTLDVNGIWGGHQGEGPKTIIPAFAGAKISMRLVPNQSSREIADKFEKYVRSIASPFVDVDIKQTSDGEPVILDTSSKYFKAAEDAYAKVFGEKPIYKLSGASIPITATLKKLLGIDSILMGYGLPDDGLHSPNEKFSLRMFEKGIKTNVEFLNSF